MNKLLKSIGAIVIASFVCSIQTVCAADGIVKIFGAGEVPQAISYSVNHIDAYILTQKKVYKLSKGKMELFYESNVPLYCLFVNDSSVWIGVDNGVLVLQIKNKVQSFFKIDAAVLTCKSVTIFKSADQHIYIGTDAYGLYAYRAHNVPEKVSTMFPINKGVATADSTIWVGTDVGLFRNRKNDWVRYNEEGVSNFEIPDNIVQNLVVDNTGLLWVLMRNGLAVIETPQYLNKTKSHAQPDEHGHIPSTEYLGRAQNSIYDVHYYKNKGYVFATDMGLLYLPTYKDEEVIENFHHNDGDKVENKALLKMPDIAAINNKYGKILFINDQKSNTYFICERGIYKLNKKMLIHLLS